MATPRKGPSLSGPLTGWTASSLTPMATVTNTLPTPPIVNAPQPLPLANPPTNLSQYNLTNAELGIGTGRGRNDMGGGRGTFATPTPLESLLASIFPDAAMGSDPSPMNPNTNAPQSGALFRTILGNLGADMGAGPTSLPAPVIAGPAGVGSQLAATIPGAPPFLGSAIDRVTTAGSAAAPTVAGGVGGLNAMGIAALAAEQRAQANQLAQEQAAANAAYFEQQQAQQRAQRFAEQRRRQRFGGVNALTSGWSSSPVLF